MTTLDSQYLTPARLSPDHEHPHSDDYQDIYHHPESGIEESDYVFIQGNQLRQRWQTSATSQPHFCVAETGFGTGLNFLLTCQAWRQTTPRPGRLYFISTELHPLAGEDLAQCHQQHPELNPWLNRLLSQYGSTRPGVHRYQIDDDICLTLLLGDAANCLSQLNARVDAWFLDGFAPNRNPAMWSVPLFDEIQRLSKNGSTVATFTAASAIRKQLETHGFQVSKQPGFGRKREMITAAQTDSPVQAQHNPKPWYPLTDFNHHQSVTIIGAGIAGLSLARCFKQRGFEVVMVDACPEPMLAGSGNPWAMVMPMLTTRPSLESLLSLRAFEHALQQYPSDLFNPLGVLDKKHKNHHWPLPDQLRSSTKAGGFFKTSGAINNKALAKRWQQFIDQWITNRLCRISHDNGRWVLHEKDQIVHASELLILAAGMNTQALLPQHHWGMTGKLGQTTLIKTQAPLPVENILKDQGYLIPTTNPAEYLLGASFEHLPEPAWYEQPTTKDARNSANFDHWNNHDFYNQIKHSKVIGTHAAIRATTIDHQPICGPVTDQNLFAKDYANLHHGRHWEVLPPAQTLPGLYALTGLGSRGFTTAPLLAELLASMICDEPLPLEHDLCMMIHPNRFLYRQLKKPPHEREL